MAVANVFNDTGRFWEIGTADIISFRDHDDPNSGLLPVTIRKIVLEPAATGDGVALQTLQTSSTPLLTLAAEACTVNNTTRITDASGACFVGVAVGDWMHLWSSTGTSANLGWYYISAVDGSDTYVEVENGQNALTAESGEKYNMKFYTPENCMIMVTPTGDTGGALVQSEHYDWGDTGRRFYNLSVHALSSNAIVYIYLK